MNEEPWFYKPFLQKWVDGKIFYPLANTINGVTLKHNRKFTDEEYNKIMQFFEPHSYSKIKTCIFTSSIFKSIFVRKMIFLREAKEYVFVDSITPVNNHHFLLAVINL